MQHVFLQHGVCGLFSVEAGGDSRRLSKCGQRPAGRPAAALRWGRALGHECGSRPRATRCQICIDAPPGRRGSLVRNAAARHDERPTEAACEACWAASGKSQAEGALRRAFFAWRCGNRSDLGCAPKRVDLWGVGEGPAAATPGAGTVCNQPRRPPAKKMRLIPRSSLLLSPSARIRAAQQLSYDP